MESAKRATLVPMSETLGIDAEALEAVIARLAVAADAASGIRPKGVPLARLDEDIRADVQELGSTWTDEATRFAESLSTFGVAVRRARAELARVDQVIADAARAV
jgi:hypothetical protein